MKKKAANIIYIISGIMLFASLIIRYGLGFFSRIWIRRNLDKNHIISAVSSNNSPISVLLTKVNKKSAKKSYGKDHTWLFLRLTWLDIIRRLLAFLSGAGIVFYSIYKIVRYLKNKES